MQQIQQLWRQLHSEHIHMEHRNNWERWHLDPILLGGLLILSIIGLVILFSAGSRDTDLIIRQIIRLGLAFSVMLIAAQISPINYRLWAPWLYGVGLILLFAVMVIGEIGKGAQRWLDLGILTFQPSEVMKLAVPMMIARYLSNHHLPPPPTKILFAGIMIMMPVLFIVEQPDLGTGLMLAISGGGVLLLAGISWYLISALLLIAAAIAPVLWHFLHDYQRNRVLTFLNPERDPLGSGYHIIQSKIAVGSGGMFGKGWINGTQSQLHFLPEHATDFIFAVCGEEFGLLGGIILISAYVFITCRGFYIAVSAQDTFTRLLAGSISLSFFLSAFVNIGMVTGLLPVVGVPLPLVSYGGTSMVTMMASLGILMSIQTHRYLLTN